MKVICKMHQEQLSASLGTPHASFHITLSHEQLVQLQVASDFIAIEGLLDLACKEFGTVLDACTAEEIRTRFQIPNDIAEDEAPTSRALRK